MLTQSKLHKLLTYDGKSGAFYWLVNRSNRVSPGALAGYKRKDGYISIKLIEGRFFAHRLAWLYVNGRWPTEEIDHLDGDPSNNSINNLREVTRSQNLQNQRNPHIDNRFGALGIRFRKGKWEPRIKVNGRQLNLGRFISLRAAKSAYKKAKSIYHGINL